MRKKTLGIFLISLAIVCFSSFGWAQRTTQTGTLNGTVSDDEGVPLPGVTVTASSPSLMLPQVSTVTDTKGFFRLPQLPTGYYKIVFELDNFSTMIREKLKINLGSVTSLDIEMKPSTIEETILVIGRGPTVDKQSTSLGINLTPDFLANIPSGRDFTDVFEMAPGVTSVGGRPASHGSTVRDNAFNIDGVIINDPQTGAYGSIQISYEVAEEYQVQTGGHSAEYGSVRGSMINLITRSGSNKLTGEANFYFMHNDLQSDNTAGTPFEGKFIGFNYDIDTTFQLGGPVVKDKLWFFANYSYTYSETFYEGFPYDKEEHVPSAYQKHFPYIKLSWQINPAMKLVGSWNLGFRERTNRNPTRFKNEDTVRNAKYKQNQSNMTFSYIISNNLIYTAKAALILYTADYLRKNDFPSYYGNDTRLYSGGYGYDSLTDRNRAQFLTDATYYVDGSTGQHEFKTGIEFVYSWDTYGRVYSKDSRNNAGYRFYTRNDGEPYRVYDYEEYHQKQNAYSYGFFIQDRWNPIKRLTLNLGIRFDRQEGVIPPQGEDRTPAVYGGVTYDPRVTETIKPLKWNTFSPRLGVSYDLTGDGKTVLKSSFGRYYLAGISQYFNKANPNGQTYWRYYLNSDWSLGRLYRLNTTASTQIDPDYKAPYLDEFIVGIQRELIPDLSLSINYIRKWDRNQIENIILEALDVEAIKNGEYNWMNYTLVSAVDPFDGNTVSFYEQDVTLVTETAYITNPKPAKRNYNGLELILNKRFTNNWQMMASYTYAKSTGLIAGDYSETSGARAYFNEPNSHINALGRLPGERRHQIKLLGTYQAPLGILISTYYRGFSGARYTRRIRSNDLGLSLEQGTVTIYAEERGSRGLPWLHIWDMRIEKRFNFKDRFDLGIIFDAFNMLNLNTTTSVESISSSSAEFESVAGIMNPRVVRLGIRFSW